MQQDSLSLVVSGSTEEDTTGAGANVAHLMLDLEPTNFDWRKEGPDLVDDPLFLEWAPGVVDTLFVSAFQNQHVAYVRVARAAQAIGLTAGVYGDVATLIRSVASLRQALLGSRSHKLLPLSVWLVSNDARLEASKVVEALMILPDDEALLEEALTVCTACVDVFPSFVDVLFRPQASEVVLSWIRAAAAASTLHVEWNVST